MSDAHPPPDNPVNPAVSYERTDASFAAVAGFGIGLASVCALCAALLWWMYVTEIAHENAVKKSDVPWWKSADRASPVQRTQPSHLDRGTERSGIDPKPPLEGFDPSSPAHDIGRIRPGTAQQQQKEEEDHLKSTGWVDRKKGIVHIPIEQAMKKVAGELKARDGTAEDEFLQAPSRSSSGREPRGAKP
jgi:hypothetical protein